LISGIKSWRSIKGLKGESTVGLTIRSGSGLGIDTASKVGLQFGALLARVGLGIIEVAEIISRYNL
jgi:hypothetical protein